MEEIDKIVMMVCVFLKKKNALEKYCINAVEFSNLRINMSDQMGMRHSLRDRVKAIVWYKANRIYQLHAHPSAYFRDFFMLYESAFNWAKSNEGTHYWEVINTAWRLFYKENKERYGL